MEHCTNHPKKTRLFPFVCFVSLRFVSFRLNLKDLKENEMHHNHTTVQTHRFQRADCIFITLHWDTQLGFGTVVLHRCICRWRQIEIYSQPTVFYSLLMGSMIAQSQRR